MLRFNADQGPQELKWIWAAGGIKVNAGNQRHRKSWDWITLEKQEADRITTVCLLTKGHLGQADPVRPWPAATKALQVRTGSTNLRNILQDFTDQFLFQKGELSMKLRQKGCLVKSAVNLEQFNMQQQILSCCSRDQNHCRNMGWINLYNCQQPARFPRHILIAPLVIVYYYTSIYFADAGYESCKYSWCKQLSAGTQAWVS